MASSPALSSFALRPILPAGGAPTAVTSGDFNKDGHLDWAIANGADNSIWVYIGRGDGSSNPPTIILLTGIAPLSLVAVDLRGIGTLDLVVAEADSGTVGVLLGNGDGTFQAEVEYSVAAPPLFLVAADFNGDGKADIVVGLNDTTAPGPIATLLGDGAGHLGAPSYASAQWQWTAPWLAVADLNGDGKPDLVALLYPVYPGLEPPGGSQVYLNNGDGTFTPGQQFDTNNPNILGIPAYLVLSAALADLNGDGCADAVLTDSYGLAEVYTGTCTGTFNVPKVSQYPLGDSGAAVQLIDVNHDGNLDIVSTGAASSDAGGPGFGSVAGNLVSVLFGDGTAHFGSGRTYRGEPLMLSFSVGDLNGDGFPDLITANQGSNSASVFLNDGSGGFGDPQGEPIGYDSGATNSPAGPIAVVDVDGNGTKDLVLLQVPPYFPGQEEITTLLNDGSGKFSAPIESYEWQESVGFLTDFVLADFRNTGRPDMLALADGGALYFAPNIGAGRFGPPTSTTLTAAKGGPLAVGDFNGDGKLDFATTTVPPNGPGQLCIYLGNGDGTFQAGAILNFQLYAPTVGQIYAGDFNRDGKTDLLVLDGVLYEFLGNGDGTFQPARQLFQSFAGFTLADINRDGWLDIITTNNLGSSAFYIPAILTYLGQPDGSFAAGPTYIPYLDNMVFPQVWGTQIPGSPFQAVPGDFNGDGNTDLAIFQIPWWPLVNSFVQILYGNGDGTFTPSYVSYPLNKRYIPQFAADINGDGLADLIELDNYTSSFNVLKSAAGAPALQLQILASPIAGPTGYGRVTLNLPSASATAITLTASDPNVSVPSVVIPAGTISQDFQFSVGKGFNPHNVFSIQAQLGATTATAYNYTSITPTVVPVFEPSGLLYYNMNAGITSDPQSITLHNFGSAPMSITSIFSGGPESDDCGSSLAGGASCNIQASMKAQYPGLIPGALTVAYSDNTYSVSALQNAFVSSLQFTPCCSLNFVQTPGSTSPAQSITVTNQESIPLQITSGITVGGYGFAETNKCGTLAPGASCQINVTFNPTQSGPAEDNLSILQSPPTDYQYLVSLTGTAQDFSLISSIPTATVTAGQTATYTGSVISLDDFAGTVKLSCSGAPTGSTCSITPSSVSVAANGSTVFTVTVSTAGSSSGSIQQRGNGRVRWGSGAFLSFLVLAGVIACSTRKSRLRRKAHAFTLIFFALLVCSCGGGGSNSSSGSGGGGGGGGGTSSATYTLTISGVVGSATRTVELTLTIQ